MNENVEYVIRIVLRARDDFSKQMAALRKELDDSRSMAAALDSALDSLNTKITNLNNRSRNAAESLGRLKKATDDLGGSVDKIVIVEGTLADATKKSSDASDEQRKTLDATTRSRLKDGAATVAHARQQREASASVRRDIKAESDAKAARVE